MLKKLLLFCLCAPLCCFAGIDVLQSMRGASAKNMEGAQGSWERSGKTVKFISTAAQGYQGAGQHYKTENGSKDSLCHD